MAPTSWPLAWLGLGSKVSIWLGPPLSHSTIQLGLGFALAPLRGGASRCAGGRGGRPAGGSFWAKAVRSSVPVVTRAAMRARAERALLFRVHMLSSAPRARDTALAEAVPSAPWPAANCRAARVVSRTT